MYQYGHINLYHSSMPDCIATSLKTHRPHPTSLLSPKMILTLKRYAKISQSTQPFILHQILLQRNTISILQNTNALSGLFPCKLAVSISSMVCTL